MRPPIPALSGSTFPAADCAGGSRSAGRNCTGRSRPCSAQPAPGPPNWISSLVRDAGMADYNLRYMGCHGPTNVLSFPIDEQIAGPEDEDVPIQLGSLVFSVDTLHRETLLYGQDPEEHCLRLLAHGLGHLAGYDHGPEMDELCSEMLSAAEAWLTAQ